MTELISFLAGKRKRLIDDKQKQQWKNGNYEEKHITTSQLKVKKPRGNQLITRVN